MQSRMLIAAVLILAGCGTADIEGSSEYAELRDERDALEAELDEVRAELDEVDDALAVAAAQLDQAETEAVDGDTIAADFDELLVLDVMNRVGLSPGDARCVVDEFLADPEVRSAYLLLIDPSQTDADATEVAYGQVTAIMEGCGLDIVQDEATSRSETLAALAEVLGVVELVGEALPPYVAGAADTAVGMPAPVVIGADYAGSPVTIDAAADGPTMVIVMAHWCPHCNAEIPKLNQLRDEGRIPDGVNIVAVSSGLNPDRANFPPDEWLTDGGWTFPVVADGLDESGQFVASAAYGTAGVPHVTLIDGDGNVTARWSGERDVEFLATALAGLGSG